MAHALSAIAITAGRLVWSEQVRRNAFYDWKRRLRGEPMLPEGPIRHVLVICKGNICRSPFAANLLSAHPISAQVLSAGLEAGCDDPADPSAVRAASRRGMALDAHRTRRLTGTDIAWADLVVGMEGTHAAALAARWPVARAKVRLLGHFLANPPYTIDDPWGHSEEVFDHTFDRIERAVERLAHRLAERRK